MRYFVLIGLVSFSISAGVATAGNAPATQPTTRPAVVAPPSATDRAQIDKAIKELASDVWKDREDAQKELVRIGAAAIPALKELAAKGQDNEVRTRAAAAIRQIEENSFIGGSTITLQVKDANPAEVFDQIAKQARCEFALYPKNLFQQAHMQRPITMDLQNVNFWVAFKEACQKAGVFPQQMGNERRMTLSQGASSYFNGPTVTNGPFLIVANRIYRSHSVDLGNVNNVQNEFNMMFTAFCEPKIKVVQSGYQVKLEEAVDDKGNSLLPPAGPTYEGMNGGTQWMWNLSARLNYPEGAGKRIAKVRGNVRFVIQLKSETLDIPNVMTVKNVEKSFAGRRLLLKEVKKNGQQYEVQATIFRDGLSAAEWSQMHGSMQGVKLVDAEGRSLSPQGWGGGGGDQKLDYTWNFGRQGWGGEEGKIGEPHRLVWEVPTETRDMAVAFEFKDLPLP